MSDNQLNSARFPRSSRYHPGWVLAGISGGANSLWLTEWLTEAMPLQDVSQPRNRHGHDRNGHDRTLRQR